MKFFNKFAIFIILFAIAISLIIFYVQPVETAILCLVIITILALVPAFVFTRKHSRLIEQIDNNLKAIADKNYQETIITVSREYSEMSSNLDQIRNRLIKYQEKLSRQKEGFNAIIESINEAIWIQDQKGIITTSNQSFKGLINREDVDKQYFWNVIGIKELYEFADSIFKLPKNKITEIEFNDRFYICSASYSSLLEETVFIIYDISEIRQLEIMKKDFALNVSHELRTPLTSIKGFLETLEEELAEDQQTYVKVIKRNTDRLINIVEDLLALSRLENSLSLELSEFDLVKLVNQAIMIFEERLAEKNIRLVVLPQDELILIQADRFKLEQVLINLIDNAIKYTEEGEIRINLSREDQYTKIEVEDTGCGIPKEHIPRLFERFYVVDKSRSRKMGGTGLGLSIVKHIIQLHNGTIEAESEVGKGTKFVIHLPREIETIQ